MKTMKMIQKNKKAKSLFILIDKINLVKYKRYFIVNELNNKGMKIIK